MWVGSAVWTTRPVDEMAALEGRWLRDWSSVNTRRLFVSVLVFLIALVGCFGFKVSSVAAVGGLESGVCGVGTCTAVKVGVGASESSGLVGCLRHARADLGSGAVAGSRTVAGVLTVSFRGLSDDVARGFTRLPTTITDDTARIATNYLATGSDEAVFWSGIGRGGDATAA